MATKAWMPAISHSYKHEAPGIPWPDYLLPYLEYSSLLKDARSFNDGQMWILVAAWSRGGGYICSDLVYSDGKYFTGEDGDDYSNIRRGVGDLGSRVTISGIAVSTSISATTSDQVPP